MKFTIATFCFGLGVACANSPLLPLQAPSSPFQLNQASDVQEFPVEWEGTSLVAGPKRIVMSSDGEIKILANGREVVTADMPLQIINSETQDRQWVAPVQNYPADGFSREEASFAKEGDVLTCKKVLHVEDQRSVLTTSLELLDDGLARLSYAWEPLKEPFQLYSRTVIVSMPQFEAEGSSFDLDGKVGSITASSEGTLGEAKDFQKLEIDPANPSRSFSLLGTQDSGSLLAQVRDDSKSIWYRVSEPKGTHRIELLIDIRKGTAVKRSGQVMGGIDFNAIEGITLPDYNSSRNLLSNPSFDQGVRTYNLLERTKLPQEWGVSPYALDQETAWSGDSSLRLTAPKSTGSDFRFVGLPMRTMAIPLNPGTYTFSLYAKTLQDARLSVWFPNAAWVGNRKTSLPIGWKSWKEAGAQAIFEISGDWKRYSLTFEVPASMPVFAVFGAESPEGTGQVWIDGLQLEKSAEPTAFTQRPAAGRLLTSSEDNFLEPGDPLEARLELTAGPQAEGQVEVEVTDFFGETLAKDTLDFTTDDQGRSVVDLPWEGKLPRGIFVVKATYRLADGTSTFDFHRLAIMDFLENKHRLKGFFSDDYTDTASERFDFLALLDRYRKTGVGGKNHSYRWDNEEVWKAYQDAGFMLTDSVMSQRMAPYTGVHSKVVGFALAGELLGNGLRPEDSRILIRDFNHDSNGEITDAWLKKFKDTVATLAAEHPWVPMWSLGNEVYSNYPVEWWSKDGDPDKAFRKYAILQKAFIEAVKQGNPEAKVYQGAPSNMSPNGGIAETGHTIAELNKLGDVKFDWIGIHCYRATPESPDLDADAQTLFDLLDKNGYEDVPVFWPEGMHYGPYTIPQWGIVSASWLPPSVWLYGTLTYDMGWSEKISAAWRARSWLVGLKYQNRVKSAVSSGFINNLDMDIDHTPFATQKISNTLGKLLGDAEFRKDVRFASYIRCYIFEDAQQRPVAAVWCHHPKLDAGMMQPPVAEAEFVHGSAMQIFDLMEAQREFSPDAEGKFTFPVSSFPLFFRGEPGTLASFEKIFEEASVISGEGVAPIMLASRPLAADQVEITVTNLLSKPFTGELICGPTQQTLKVPSAGQAKTTLPLPIALSADRIQEESLPLTLRSEQSSLDLDLSFRGLLGQSQDSPIIVDGKLDDWASTPAVPFTGRQLYDAKTVTDEDFSGHFQIAWTPQGLYLAVSVVDDHLAVKDWPKPGDRWNNDSLQIYFDTMGDARSRQQHGFDENDYDYAVHPSADGLHSEVFRRLSPDPQLGLATTAPPDNAITEDIPSAFSRNENGYVYEIFFPAKYLLPIRLAEGQGFGLGLTVNDKDEADGPRRSSMTNLLDGQDCFLRPHLWPYVLLD
jgi:hypothetical protein